MFLRRWTYPMYGTHGKLWVYNWSFEFNAKLLDILHGVFYDLRLQDQKKYPYLLMCTNIFSVLSLHIH